MYIHTYIHIYIYICIRICIHVNVYTYPMISSTCPGQPGSSPGAQRKRLEREMATLRSELAKCPEHPSRPSTAPGSRWQDVKATYIYIYCKKGHIYIYMYLFLFVFLFLYIYIYVHVGIGLGIGIGTSIAIGIGTDIREAHVRHQEVPRSGEQITQNQFVEIHFVGISRKEPI